MSLLLKILGIACIAYCFAMLFLYVFQKQLIFFPVKSRVVDHPRPPFEETVIDTGEAHLQAWHVQRSKQLIIYFGGNSEDVSLNFETIPEMTKKSVLFVNYRGYGNSTGGPGEAELFHDSLAIYDYAVGSLGYAPGAIYIMGRSLGSGVAVYLASKRNCKGVILMTPYDSVYEVAQSQYPFFPIRFLLKHHFDSVRYAENLDVPALMLIADQDTVIDNEHSHRLSTAWKGRSRTVLIRGAAHNNIDKFAEYWSAINDWLGGFR